MTRNKNADYWAGYHAEAARQGRTTFADLARHVSSALGRDNARKQRIFARSPYTFAGMDAQEFGEASSRELAMRELKELGIDPGDHDPEALLDAHHAGRKYARDNFRIPGNPLSGGNVINTTDPGTEERSARDASEPSFMDRYLGGDR